MNQHISPDLCTELLFAELGRHHIHILTLSPDQIERLEIAVCARALSAHPKTAGEAYAATLAAACSVVDELD